MSSPAKAHSLKSALFRHGILLFSQKILCLVLKLRSDEEKEWHREEEDDDDDDKDFEKWVLDFTEKSGIGDFEFANLITEKEVEDGEEERFNSMIFQVPED